MSARDPIFVRGIMPRSGTNFVWDLLRLHPDCAIAREPIWEDNVLARADLLRAYARETAGTWQELGAAEQAVSEDGLFGRLGDALVSFLSTAADKRLLAKTPHVHHLDEFPALFPQGRLVIVVRDGRAVVTSALATFGGRFETYARLWARAADAITAFDRDQSGPAARHRVVRYEDLVADVEGTMRSLLAFLDLDACRYDFEAASRLPVRGSSVVGAEAGVHWDPVRTPDGFDPTHRSADWSPRLHRRFNWIASEQLERFGYEPVGKRRGTARNLALDLAWGCAQPLRPLRRRLVAALGRG